MNLSESFTKRLKILAGILTENVAPQTQQQTNVAPQQTHQQSNAQQNNNQTQRQRAGQQDYSNVQIGHQAFVEYNGKKYIVKINGIYDTRGQSIPASKDAMVGIDWSLDGKTRRRDSVPIEQLEMFK